MLNIGSVKLKNWLIMAPMAGITNLPFRLIVKKMGAGLVTSEMVSAMGLKQDRKKTFSYLKTAPNDSPLAVQIFGAIPQAMASAAEIVIKEGADIVDINMGCPARKVLKSGAGGALLRDPEKVREIVTAVREKCSVPLTVKIRAGWAPEQMTACDTACLIEDCGADAVSIHPRFVSQGFSGEADWSIIAKAKKRLGIPVIGNGDVTSPSLVLKMKNSTNCDGVMIGRAAVKNPWIFSQTLDFIQGLPVRQPTLKQRKSLIMEHFQLLTLSIGEHRAAFVMRGLLLKYTKELPYSSRFRGAITQIKDLETLVSTMDSFFSALEDTDFCE